MVAKSYCCYSPGHAAAHDGVQGNAYAIAEKQIALSNMLLTLVAKL